MIGSRFKVLACAAAFAVLGSTAAHAAGHGVPRVIISTDIAIGLIDTHGGKSLTPVPFDVDHAYTTDTNVVPQDIDDGLTLAMALNLDAAGLIKLLAVVPTYGNATLPAEMMVAHHIMRTLKKRYDIPLVPGAMGPATQILNPTATWFDGTNVSVARSFALSCRNEGVRVMQDKLLSPELLISREKVTILAIGPVTDVACLLYTAPPKAIRNIKEIIVLASRLEGESLQVNGTVVNDFNIRMDPVSIALLLAAKRAKTVPIRLMNFALTGQTSQRGDLIVFDAANYPGPPSPTPASRASFKWLLRAATVHNAYWKGIFGNVEGPFDQYTLAAVLKPEFFDCQAGFAYVKMCPYPAWSPKYPVDSNGDPTQEPYNAPNNPCVDHGTENGETLSENAAQLVVIGSSQRRGRLVRGKTGIDGNIPTFKNARARSVKVCTDFTGKKGRVGFERFLKAWTW